MLLVRDEVSMGSVDFSVKVGWTWGGCGKVARGRESQCPSGSY